jgi:hypothetical protein
MDTPGESATQQKFQGVGQDWLAKAESAQPMGQLVNLDQVAGLGAYLLSQQSGVITGALLTNAQAHASNIPEASQKGGRQSGVDERRSVDSGIATPSSWRTNTRRASIRRHVAGYFVCSSIRSA